ERTPAAGVHETGDDVLLLPAGPQHEIRTAALYDVDPARFPIENGQVFEVRLVGVHRLGSTVDEHLEPTLGAQVYVPAPSVVREDVSGQPIGIDEIEGLHRKLVLRGEVLERR